MVSRPASAVEISRQSLETNRISAASASRSARNHRETKSDASLILSSILNRWGARRRALSCEFYAVVKRETDRVVSQFEIQRFGGQNEFKSAGKSGWGNG